MKVERRHELEKNELLLWINSLTAGIKPYQNAILGVVLLVLVILIAYTVLSRRSAQSAAVAWDDLYSAMGSDTMSPIQFEELVKKHSGTTTAHWAALLAAEIHLERGCNELFTNKATAREDLDRAREQFLQILDETRVDVLRERATFGLAQTDEALGNLPKAIESWSSPALQKAGQKPDRGYRGVLNLWPNGSYTVVAEARIAELERPATAKFYDDFARWEPKPSSSEGPGKPGVRPPTDLMLPDDKPLYSPGELLKPDAKGAGEVKPGELLVPSPKKPPAKETTPEAKPATKPSPQAPPKENVPKPVEKPAKPAP
jgi:predicted negative regulator of RcsB-dependent stress response